MFLAPVKEALRAMNNDVCDISCPGKSGISAGRARFDGKGFLYIAYSSIADDAGSKNTLEHFEYCCKSGFNAIKGDVRITADGELIMCHDAGFTLNENGYISTYHRLNCTPIRAMTNSACLALRHEGTLNSVVDFDAYIRTCKKYGKVAFITIRDEYIDEVTKRVLAVLDKYHYRRMSIVNSFTYESLQTVRTADPEMMLSWVQKASAVMTKTMVDGCDDLGNCVLCMYHFPNKGEFDAIDRDVLEYAVRKDIRVYEAIVPSDKVEKLIEYGFAGAQISSVPEWLRLN
jgi:hypothetical protein